MRKILISSLLFAGVLFLGSCEKDEIGGTATQSLAGQWYITIDGVDALGNPIDSCADFYGLGRQMILTYNTAANSASEMIVDMSQLETDFPFLWIKAAIPCNASSRTFGSSSYTVENSIIYDYNFSEADTTFVPADTVEVDEEIFSCLNDTTIEVYDSTYITIDTLYKQQDTTFVTVDTMFVGVDTSYQYTRIDTLISPLVIDTIIRDSMAVIFAHTEIIPADTILSPAAPYIDKIKIWNGKITKNGAVTPSGMPADLFEFEFTTDGDDAGYYLQADTVEGCYRMGMSFGEWGGFDHYKVSGYRYTGFENDEE